MDDFEHCYRALSSRDERFDGWFYTAVTSTGIYCRPSCPATTPKRVNVRFYRTSAAAQEAGFRACKRCRPDATPGSPAWNLRADVVARAMRLIADGVVERDGVAGLARRLGYSERHLSRVLTEEVGAGPLALARAQRAQSARVLIESTRVPFTEVAFAAGFASIRQFNDVVKTVFDLTPTELRRRAGPDVAGAPGTVVLRLPYRRPFAAGEMMSFFAARAVPGVEESDGATFKRSLRLPHGSGIAELSARDGHVSCRLSLDDPRDLTVAVARCRRLLDLDADPFAVDRQLEGDSLLAPLVARAPGMRVPGTADPAEHAIRAVIGQQISVAGARTIAGRLVARYGKPLTAPHGALTHVFPEPAALADADPSDLPMPAARRRAVMTLASALASGELCLDPGADRLEAHRRLVALPGIGPWTASYIGMRALGDPDAFPASDLGVRRALERLGDPIAPRDVLVGAERWRPWRAYATHYLWSSLAVPLTS
ncbi:MAG: AlkA N-terminal domain-containing protein [Actinomycetota bacterium]